MKLVRHKIVEAPFTPARQVGGEIVPTIVILHDTAGRIDERLKSYGASVERIQEWLTEQGR